MRQVLWAGRAVAVDIHPAVVRAARREGNALTIQMKLVFG